MSQEIPVHATCHCVISRTFERWDGNCIHVKICPISHERMGATPTTFFFFYLVWALKYHAIKLGWPSFIEFFHESRWLHIQFWPSHVVMLTYVIYYLTTTPCALSILVLKWTIFMLKIISHVLILTLVDVNSVYWSLFLIFIV